MSIYKNIFNDFLTAKNNFNREIAPKEPLGYQDIYETEQQKIRDASFSKLLNIYVQEVGYKTKANKKYRGMIFWATFIAMCATLLLGLFVIFYSAVFGSDNSENNLKIASGCVAILTTLIILPKILIKYLFPSDEQKSISNLIEVLQKNDLGTKSLIHQSELKCLECPKQEDKIKKAIDNENPKKTP